MKHVFLLLSMLGIGANLSAQKPYFQQEVNYTIAVTLDDKVHQVKGTISMEYSNHSPDALSEIWMHLWGNAYQNKHTAFAKQQLTNGKVKFQYAKNEDLGGYSDLDFRVDGEKVTWEYDKENPDIAVLKLAKPLASGAKMTITTPFTLTVPASFSRLGHVGDSYQMTQWFPKPAVYNNKGWNPIPYLDQGEFFSEFGSFDVSITLPENYVVGATGVLQNESEKDFLATKIRETTAQKAKGFDKNTAFPPSATQMKILRYKAENVHDFAWFADKRFWVTKEIVTLTSGKTVDCWGMFTNEEADIWTKGAEYVARAVKFYSDNVGEYPYPHATAVQSALSAGGGMEYPMITVIGKTGEPKSLDNVITHEVGHNWFYGILASNEREHGWMDEGMNTFYENRYMKTYYANTKTEVKRKGISLNLDFSEIGTQAVDWFGRAHLDQAPDTHSADLLSLNYGLDMYQKTGRSMKALEEYIGLENYDKTMKAYYDKWKFRHPYPEDFRKHWEAAFPDKNLAWFFNGLIKSNQKVDYNFRRISPKNRVGEEAQFKVTHSGLAIPLPITAMKDGKEVATQWFDFPKDKKRSIITFPQGDYDEVVIDAHKLLPDVYRVRNRIKANGKFRSVFPIKPLNLIENEKRFKTYGLLPTTAYNFYDKWQLGAVLYTPLFPTARNGYLYIAPLYSFENKSWNFNMGLLGTHYFRKGILQSLTFEWNLRTFAMNKEQSLAITKSNYIRRNIAISTQFRKKTANSPTNHALSLRRIDVNNTFISSTNFGTFSLNFGVNELQYKYENTFVLRPMTVTATAQAAEGFAKLFGHYNQRFLLNSKKHCLDVHAFAGSFLYYDGLTLSQKNLGNVAFQVGGGTGIGINQRDYLYDNLLFARGDRNPGSVGGTWLTQQVYMQDAGLKTQGYVAGNTKWMAGGGVAYRLPIPTLGIYPYFDGAIYPAGNTIDGAWSSGIRLTVLKDILDVYFPIIESKTVLYSNRLKYGQRISFALNLNRLNPYKLLRDLRLNL